MPDKIKKWQESKKAFGILIKSIDDEIYLMQQKRWAYELAIEELDNKINTFSGKENQNRNTSGQNNNSNDPGEYEMPFGKEKGKKLKNIDEDYVKWVAFEMDATNSTGKEAQRMAKQYLNN